MRDGEQFAVAIFFQKSAFAFFEQTIERQQSFSPLLLFSLSRQLCVPHSAAQRG